MLTFAHFNHADRPPLKSHLPIALTVHYHNSVSWLSMLLAYSDFHMSAHPQGRVRPNLVYWFRCIRVLIRCV